MSESPIQPGGDPAPVLPEAAPTAFRPIPRNFRHLTNPPNVLMREVGPFILIKAGGEAGFGSTPETKDVLLKMFEPEKGDLLLWAWPGKVRTDVFQITPGDLLLYYNVR